MPSPATAETVDLGDLCVWCREDTSFGSGKFVNRIPVSTTASELPYHILWEEPSAIIEGYGCQECYDE